MLCYNDPNLIVFQYFTTMHVYLCYAIYNGLNNALSRLALHVLATYLENVYFSNVSRTLTGVLTCRWLKWREHIIA